MSELASSEFAPRKRWIAVLFSLLTPGAGHLYDGLPTLAVMMWLLGNLGSILALELALHLRGPAQLLTILLASVGVTVLIAWDAARRARAASPSYAPRRYNRWFLYAIIFVATPLLVQPAERRYLMAHVMRAYHLPSASMSPLLQSGDYIIAVPLRGDPTREEVVAYGDGSQTFVKRIVGVPGDTLRMISGILYLNQKRFDEPYASRADSDPTDSDFVWQRDYLLPSVDRAHYQPSLNSWGPLLVPHGQYFVLGDNRGNSLDSRYAGFVPRRSVYSRPTIVYFSRDSEAKRVRWHRIGLGIQ